MRQKDSTTRRTERNSLVCYLTAPHHMTGKLMRGCHFPEQTTAWQSPSERPFCHITSSCFSSLSLDFKNIKDLDVYLIAYSTTTPHKLLATEKQVMKQTVRA